MLSREELGEASTLTRLASRIRFGVWESFIKFLQINKSKGALIICMIEALLSQNVSLRSQVSSYLLDCHSLFKRIDSSRKCIVTPKQMHQFFKPKASQQQLARLIRQLIPSSKGQNLSYLQFCRAFFQFETKQRPSLSLQSLLTALIDNQVQITRLLNKDSSSLQRVSPIYHSLLKRKLKGASRETSGARAQDLPKQQQISQSLLSLKEKILQDFQRQVDKLKKTMVRTLDEQLTARLSSYPSNLTSKTADTQSDYRSRPNRIWVRPSKERRNAEPGSRQRWRGQRRTGRASRSPDEGEGRWPRVGWWLK